MGRKTEQTGVEVDEEVHLKLLKESAFYLPAALVLCYAQPTEVEGVLARFPGGKSEKVKK